MQAIIFANRNGNELAPLNDYFCPALMKVANKAVVEYTLDNLKQAGFSRATLVAANDISKLKDHLQDGSRWGIEIDYVLSKPQESVASVLNKLKLDTNTKNLLIRGDMIIAASISEYIELCQHMPSTFISAKLNGANPGILMLPAAKEHLSMLDWPLTTNHQAAATCGSTVEKASVSQILHGECFYLDNFASIIAANRYILTHPLKFTLSGRQVNPNKNQWLEHQVHLTSPQHFNGSVGAFSHIDANAKISGYVSLGQHTYVGESSIKDSIVMDNTSIGDGLNLDNMIVVENTLINAISGQVVTIHDDNIIAAVNSPTLQGQHLAHQNLTAAHINGEQTGLNPSQSVSAGQKLCSLMLLLLSLPVMVISIFQGIMKGQRNIWISYKAQDNQSGSIKMFELNCKNPLVRHLPKLQHVLSGKLQLFGAAPELTDKDASFDSSAPQKPIKRYGVFGPVQLFLNKPPKEEVDLIELEYANLSQWGYLQKLLATRS
ncbi:NDP-sugar synthase [Shewanella maritima]|uniref:NDP-sugar synthase n=1 Tax=Shewanella maritima TaxID=2520507 RepID=A0A411PL26_9GAMM|nr:NDP-sugar synthase [Shewanella maritima]QBF84219.1 NDP-sugar synthase [Shewanella maritima]